MQLSQIQLSRLRQNHIRYDPTVRFNFRKYRHCSLHLMRLLHERFKSASSAPTSKISGN